MVNPARADKSPAEAIGGAIFGAAKPLHKEGEQRRRDSNRRSRESYFTRPVHIHQKDIVFSVLPRAMRSAGSYFSARDLFYGTRALCYTHPHWPAGQELKYNYFSQTLLTEYQEANGPIEGLWRDPRGNLHEPHTGRVVPLGTREVADYDFPEWTFDKVLYVEKEGEMPKLKEAGLAERYDMAVVSGKGYPVEAIRSLFERAEAGDYQLFVFHDADLDGYNIARILAEETRRMPGYSVNTVDIGLTVEDALEMELASEPFSRSNDISGALYFSLSDVAREYLYRRARYKKGVFGERFELNAILPDTRRIGYIERKLQENGVRGKVIPPEDKLKELAEEMYRDKHAEWVDEAITEIVDADKIKEEVADSFIESFELEHARRYIEEAFQADVALPWRKALEDKLQALGDGRADDLREAVHGHVREALKGGES